MKLAVIADDSSIQCFALNALDMLDGTDAISVFSCTNTRRRRKVFKHGAYYALNLLSVRNPLTRSVPLDRGKKRIAEFVEFEYL